jgi:hypothetical protein
MIAVEGKDFLRLVIFSGIVGFGIFCLSYGIHVWRKRNASLSRKRTPAICLAQAVGLFGCLSMAGSWAFNEFQGRGGVAGGGDLFVVHARKDSTPRKLPSGESVENGAVLAEFMSPPDEARMAAIEAQQAKAKAKRDAIRSSPLVFDQGLLQEQSHLRAEQSQLKGFAFDLQRSIRETEKNRADLFSAWGREKSQLEVELAAADAELNSAVSRLEVATRALSRAEELKKRGYTFEQTLDQRASDQTIANLNMQRYTAVRASAGQRLEALSQRFRTDDEALEQHLNALKADFSAVRRNLTDVNARLTEAETRVDADRARARRAVAGEVEAAEHEIAVLAAEKDRLLETSQVRAPFAGHVVYRAAAPGLVNDNEPILAISTGMGFTAKIRIPKSELDQLARAKEPLQLALDEPVLHKFFTGRFVRAEPMAFEPDRVIAYIECALPPEIIAFLGKSSKLAHVRLLWRPPLLLQTGFLLGLGLVLASIGLATAHLNRSRVALPELVHMVSNRVRRPLAPAGRNPTAEALPRLAARFGRELRKGQLEIATLEAVEHALAAGGTRAAEIMRQEISMDLDLIRAARRCIESSNSDTSSRLTSVLKTMQPLTQAA